jgi:hypothetical protein
MQDQMIGSRRGEESWKKGVHGFVCKACQNEGAILFFMFLDEANRNDDLTYERARHLRDASFSEHVPCSCRTPCKEWFPSFLAQPSW